MKKGILILTILVVSIFLTHVKADTWRTHFLGTISEGGNALDYETEYLYDYVYKTANTYTEYKQTWNFQTPLGTIPTAYNVKIYGYIKDAYFGDDVYHCTNISGTNNICTDWRSETKELQLQVWFGGTTWQCQIDWNDAPMANSQRENMFFTATCPYDYRYTTGDKMIIQYYMDDTNSNSAHSYRIGINRNIQVIESGESNIINNQNQNTQNIINNQNQNNQNIMSEINQTADYNETLNTNQKGANETIQAGQMENELINATDFNQSLLDGMTINTNASSFIWEIVERLRGMNIAIVTIFTSIMGMGILKLVLNR